MQSYSLVAPAKINLYLEILGDRPDGYHELAMVLQSIALADQLDLRPNGTDRFRILCPHPDVPKGKSNLSYQAALLMAEQFPDAFEKYGGVDIAIQKNIPIGAGLAGGSTNGAAVLVGLDLMWGLGLTQDELQDLSARLGSDMPFCVAGGTAIATGRGEKLAPLPPLDNLHLVLAKYRSLSVATAWAYQTYRQEFSHTYLSGKEGLEGRHQQVHSGDLVKAISQKNAVAIGQHLYNDLEKVVLPAYPQVAQLLEGFRQLDVLGAMMSGSGPTVFAITASEAHAERTCTDLRAMFPDDDLEIWVTETTAMGIQLIRQVKSQF
jgi:4-diphosphocytidyl-2-C-methyl-D-erythritol kinase